MYEYRRLTAEQRAELVQQRLAQGDPPHSPPHLVHDDAHYLLTATCYDHMLHMRDSRRRRQVLDAHFEEFITAGMDIQAWVVFPNHYHLLVHVTDFGALGDIFGQVHGPTARDSEIRGRRPWPEGMVSLRRSRESVPRDTTTRH